MPRMEAMICDESSLQKVPRRLFRSPMGNWKDREISPSTELNLLMRHFSGLLRAIRPPEKDEEVVEVQLSVKYLHSGILDTYLS